MLKSMQEVLEYSFSVINRLYFNNELPPIVITIISSPRTSVHFIVGEIGKQKKGITDYEVQNCYINN